MRYPEIETLERDTLAALGAVDTLDALAAWRTAALGKGAPVAALLQRIPSLPAEERPLYGQAVNAAKMRLEDAHALAAERLRRAALSSELATAAIDVTLPGTPPDLGGLHPSTIVLRELYHVFGLMGFQVYQSREVEDDTTNFELLNIPRDHPARDMQDTFYLDHERLLRTHTSPGQIRAMRERCPEPIRIVLPGMCFRNEQITPRSEIQFYQVEGLAVGRRITMADLKGTLAQFARYLFGADRGVRFRASYFPFTEPSAEMDVQCGLCRGAGCRLCKQSGWLEILGCGMVHPVVLENGGYDPGTYTGFAFGMGVERLAMLKYGIDDIRHFWANDMRFLKQFA
jgi:phenylalanyl-tRNA synthetase alpha chain